MSNSKWFWLGVCILSASAAVWLFHKDSLAANITGMVLFCFSVIYFAVDLYKPFNKWLDELH